MLHSYEPFIHSSHLLSEELNACIGRGIFTCSITEAAAARFGIQELRLRDASVRIGQEMLKEKARLASS